MISKHVKLKHNHRNCKCTQLNKKSAFQRNTCRHQQLHKRLQISPCLCCVMITLSNLMGSWKRSPHLQRSDLRNGPPPTVCWLLRLIWAKAIRVVIRAEITQNSGLRCEFNFTSATWKSAVSYLINLAWLPASASNPCSHVSTCPARWRKESWWERTRRGGVNHGCWTIHIRTADISKPLHPKNVITNESFSLTELKKNTNFFYPENVQICDKNETVYIWTVLSILSILWAHYAAQPGLPNRCGIITILQPQHLRRPEMWFNTRADKHAANVSPNQPLQEERQCQCQSFILVSVMGGWLADTAMITLCDGDLETHGGRQRGGGGLRETSLTWLHSRALEEVWRTKLRSLDKYQHRKTPGLK